MKYFLIDGSEWVHPRNDIFDMIYDETIVDGTILHEQKRDIGGEMYCKIWGDFVEQGDICGHSCKHYVPCNGKSGRCRQLVNGFIFSDNKFMVTNGKIKMMIKKEKI